MTAVTSAWLQQQRWFAGKAGGDEPAGEERFAIADGASVSLLTVGDDRYQLVARPGPAPDALTEPETASALVRALASRQVVEGEGGHIRFHLVPGEDLTGATARPLGAEQSNSSLLVDDQWILKVFRKVQPGTNPELEVLRFLADHAAPHVPRLAGWYELDAGDRTATLGVLQVRVADAEDGWRWLLDRLPWRPQETIDALHQLGGVIATVHGALASGGPGDGFGTVATGRRGARTIAEGIQSDAARAAASLPPDRRDLRALLERAGPAAAAIARGLDAGRAIRVHGDLHLGQLLIGPAGWTVIDWEGEPSRPIDERRAHQPALRDLAGLLRSLSYAVATVERTSAAVPLAGWLAAARAALLDGYLERADPALLPATAAGIRDLLALTELEKLVYEVGYEAANRPGWLDIPAVGLEVALRGYEAA